MVSIGLFVHLHSPDGLANGHMSLLGLLPRPPILAGIVTWPFCWWWWSRWGLCVARLHVFVYSGGRTVGGLREVTQA
jgi:hypothetical protein